MKVRLGDVCTIVSGSTPKTNVSEYWDGDIKWITPAELSNDSFYLFDSSRHLSEEGMKKTGLKLFPAGTVILSSRAPIGKTAISGCDMCCNQGFKNLICSGRIFNEYLYFFLKSKTEFLNSLGRGATFKEISKGIVEEIEIPLPTYDDQKRIANELKKVTELIYLRKLQLIKLEELIKSQFIEMFGDPVTNSKGWPMYSVNALTNSIETGECLNGESRPRKDEEKAVLKVSAVTYGYFNPGECKVLFNTQDIKKNVTPQKGDLLFSRANTRELVAATAIVDRDYPNLLLPDKLWKLNLNGMVTSRYMKQALSSKTARNYFSSQATGTSGSMFNISMVKLKNLRIALPPLSLQVKFDMFVQQVDKSKFVCLKSLKNLIHYKC